MRRVIVSAAPRAFYAALRACADDDEAVILANSPFMDRATIKEWMYATQAFVIFNGYKGDEDLVDHAIKLGIPIERRTLGAAKDSQDSSGA